MMNLFQTGPLAPALPSTGTQHRGPVSGQGGPLDPVPRGPAVAKRYAVLLLLLPLVLYAAALNPFFLPASYDDIVYYSGAVSLAEEGGFKFGGKYVVDWPPGFSALLSVPFRFGLESVWTAKVCVLFCAAAGLLLAWRLFLKERRPFPLLSITLFALLPVSFLMGTRIMSEWPYFAASMLFLHVLHKLRDENCSPVWIVTAGLLLGMASMVKFTGVLLGAAVLGQMLDKSTQAGKPFVRRAILPELITAVMGATAFLYWKAKIHWQIQAGTAWNYEYYPSGLAPESLGQFAAMNVPAKMTELFFHAKTAVGALGLEGWAVALACAIPGVLVLIGMLLRLTSNERTPSDWYVLSVLALFSVVGTNQQTRYLLPIAPFLIGYGFLGCHRAVQWLQLQDRQYIHRSARAGVVCWFVLLIGFATQLLFVGNLSGTHNGLSHLVSRTPETFYKGFWLDLYTACQYIQNDPAPGKLAVIGNEDKYVRAFSGRQRVSFKPGQEFAFLLVLDGTELMPEQLEELNLRRLHRPGSLVLYKKENIEPEESHHASNN
jgi:hypothetical protein